MEGSSNYDGGKAGLGKMRMIGRLRLTIRLPLALQKLGSRQPKQTVYDEKAKNMLRVFIFVTTRVKTLKSAVEYQYCPAPIYLYYLFTLTYMVDHDMQTSYELTTGHPI